MNEIPEEIRKMFPNQPIHKLDIDEHGDLHVLASAEPLSQEPDFENMPIEQVNQYLREHGYDPEQVKLNGKILTDALIENIKLTADLAAVLKRAEVAEKALPAIYENFTLVIPLDKGDQEYREWLVRLINKAGEQAGIAKVSERVAAGHLVIGYKQFAFKPDSLKGGEG